MKPSDPDATGFATRSYDIVKEFVIALVVVALLSATLAAVFSSPDDKPITISEWAKADPADFTATALAELDGSSDTAQYGAPYNNVGSGQKIGPINLQKLAGVRHRIDTAQAFVLAPLINSPQSASLSAAVVMYRSATADKQSGWTSAYSDALAKAPDGDPAQVAAGDYGPVPTLLVALLNQAQTGALDGALLSEGGFYQTDYTLPLLFVADGGYMASRAEAQHLAGDQWGMMNETGSFPGQPWLWLYTMWYQVSPFSTSDNADALVWALMMVLTLGLVFVPFLPGIRNIPKLVPIYRLVWRDHYASERKHR
jgi:hypothetical protein